MGNMEKFEAILEGHFDAVMEIYSQGIATKNATFETSCPTWSQWHDSHLPFGRWILWVDDKLAGWSALSPHSSRCVYQGVAELSIYMSEEFQGKGYGKKLLLHSIEDSEKKGIWTLKAGIFPENIGSIKLHESCGFRLIGYHEKIGRMDGIWRDTILMERRSKTIQ